MDQPCNKNHAERPSSDSDFITHPGVYHMSNFNQFNEQHQPAMMPLQTYYPGNYPPNVMYQDNGYTQYHPINQYFQPYSNIPSMGYIPGMPVQPGDVIPEFHPSLPPPFIPERHVPLDDPNTKSQRPTKRGRGRGGRNEGRGGSGGHGQREKMDSHVQSQEYYSAYRERPQQINTRGRSSGRYPSSYNQRDMRFGNGDGRHLNGRAEKHHNNDYQADSDDSKSRGNRVSAPAYESSSKRKDKKDINFRSRDERKMETQHNLGDDNLQGKTYLPLNSGRRMGQVYERKKANSTAFSQEYSTASPNTDKDESQRATLTEHLTRNQYECMVCCDIIKVESPVWSCLNCHNVFHLHCTKKWAKSSLNEESQTWRCPGCQNASSQIPNKYRCFCGRRKDPPYIRGEIPHSCGESCKKKRKGNCQHPCTLLCHPGPCPPCSSTVNQPCDCGRVRKNVMCAIAVPFKCEKVCDKQLACNEHTCEEICHSGTCELCIVSKPQDCYCGKKKRDVYCGTLEYKRISFSCENSCGRLLDCGNHVCEVLCHPGDCSVCERKPGVLSRCCCGKASIKDLNSLPDRQSCLDPVPTCGEICDKAMSCGPPENSHKCEAKCHDGECGPCDKESLVKCECGAVEKEIVCEVAVTYSAENPYKCQKRCGKKKNCGRHKCSDTCCVKDIHICEMVCGRKLTCGLHKCDQLCHRGNCGRCMETSFEELTCFCGGEILEPPVPCGTRAPECHRHCTLAHDCDHPVRHNCHRDDNCPPCIELTEKMCMGGHVLRKNIPCHLVDISCGMPCNKSLSCGMHQCQKPCHKVSCLEEGVSCSQPCTKPRKACGHMCKSQCHTGHCPDTPCKTEIIISCPCGNRSSKASCGLGGDQLAELAQFQHLSVQSMAESGFQGVDMTQFSQSKKSNKRLECDVNCAMMERNKRMALALEIKNPDICAKLGQPTFSEYLKEFAKERKNQNLILNVEKSLGELIHSAKQSSQQNRSHAFPPMNRDQRTFVHEYAECYGCETKSYDFEPSRNVVVTAFGEKCWLPNITLSLYMFGDQLPKAPPPISRLKCQGINFTTLKKKEAVSDPTPEAATASPIAPNSRAWENVSAPTASSTKITKQTPAVDYFDFSTR